MKIIALILIVSMGFLGLNRFMVALEWMQPQSELSCSMDCCSSNDGYCCVDQEHGDDQETDEAADHEKAADNQNQCQGNCDCSYSIQIVAIGTFVQSPHEISPLTFDHGVYFDNSYGEYIEPHFQPPRMA